MKIKIYFKMKKLKTRNIKVCSSPKIFTVVQLFILGNPVKVYFMVSCYFVLDNKRLYVSKN